MDRLGALYDDALDIGAAIPLHVAVMAFLVGAAAGVWLGLLLLLATPLGLAAVAVGYTLDRPGQPVSRDRLAGSLIGLGWLLMWVGVGAFVIAFFASF